MNNILKSNRINLRHNDVEQLFVEVKLNENHVSIICVCYTAPSSSLEIYSHYVESLQHVFLKYSVNTTKFLLLGDYNLPGIFFSPGSDGLMFDGVLTPQAEVI